MAVTRTTRRVVGVRSPRQPVTIVFPTMLGSRPRTGVVMSTTAWTNGAGPSTNVVVTAGLGSRLGVRS